MEAAAFFILHPKSPPLHHTIKRFSRQQIHTDIILKNSIADGVGCTIAAVVFTADVADYRFNDVDYNII